MAVLASQPRRGLGVRLDGLRDTASVRRIEQLTWAAIGLGIVARLVRYLLRFPLWGDEAFVAANFLARGYWDLLQPLEYHQVAPLLFLWAELTAVKLLGFTEWSLRLFPLLCSIGSLLLMRDVARRWCPGLPAFLAVAILAVAYYPIRHGNEVKPYAVDLFTTLALLALATRWLFERHSRWLWALAGLAPVALGLSFPAVFVAGGISLALLPSVVSDRRSSVWAAWGAMNLAMIVTFVGLYYAVAAGQYEREFASSMRDCWDLAFPPLTEPLSLLKWLAEAHTGRMFAYPVGGKNGASVLTFAAFAAALVLLWRRRQRALLAIVVLPMLLAFSAAALKRYPYGFSARTMLYLAPLICLMAALGGAWLLERARRLEARQRMVAATLVVLSLLGTGSIVRDMLKPYKTIYDWKDRAFAQWFWTDKAHDAVLVCAKTDLGLDFYPGCFEWGASSIYLCNQRIYSPEHRDGRRAFSLDEVSEQRPLRCVIYSVPGMKRDDGKFQAWLSEMQQQLRLSHHERHLLNADTTWYHEQVEVYEFVPRSTPSIAQSSGETEESVAR